MCLRRHVSLGPTAHEALECPGATALRAAEVALRGKKLLVRLQKNGRWSREGGHSSPSVSTYKNKMIYESNYTV